MPGPLENKRVILGVTGSIACYKALDLASKMVQAGALVDTVMSYGATRFVTPLAFRSITHREVVTDLFDPDSTYSIEHIELAQQADVVVIAPATAHCIAKLAAGLADDPLTTTVIATTAPLLVAPAMDGGMFHHAATQENLAKLRQRGVLIAGPASGRLASGLIGTGRLLETPELLGHIAYALGKDGDLAGRTIVISAGGTMEPIDPVRVITNHSSGKMGYALAEAGRDRGAKVILVAAPTALPDPALVEVIGVKTAQEMCDVVLQRVKGADALIMAAAVADYRPTEEAEQKIKKSGNSSLGWTSLKSRPPVSGWSEPVAGSGPGGLVNMAIAPLDIAMWDAKGKILGQPHYRLLGGHEDRVRAYASDALGTAYPWTCWPTSRMCWTCPSPRANTFTAWTPSKKPSTPGRWISLSWTWPEWAESLPG